MSDCSNHAYFISSQRTIPSTEGRTDLLAELARVTVALERVDRTVPVSPEAGLCMAAYRRRLLESKLHYERRLAA